MSTLFDPVFGRAAATASGSDDAWLAAMLRAEAALAVACAAVGLISTEDRDRVQQVCSADAPILDPNEIAAGGNPVIPLVRQLRERAGAAVHLGATSQDILDTAAMLIAQDQLRLLQRDLDTAAGACARLAAEHRNTAMIGRTLLQQARPTTFGLVAAGWGTGLDRARAELQRLEFAAQLAGPAGTGAAWYPHAAEVRRVFAATLGLSDPGGSWHTERSRISALAGALGLTASAIASIATDLVLLSQTELGEVSEASPGGSSSMPHKRNPIAAITARAAAAQAPGLVATVLSATGGPELQRGAGPWHAEWPALHSLFGTVAGAADRVRTALTGLHIQADAMLRNLGTDGTDGTDTLAAAEQVEDYLSRREETRG